MINDSHTMLKKQGFLGME